MIVCNSKTKSGDLTDCSHATYGRLAYHKGNTKLLTFESEIGMRKAFVYMLQ